MNRGKMPRRVVICDDSRIIRIMLEDAFASNPAFRVVGVANGAAEAVEHIRQLAPDLITIDLCMPYIDGTALLEMLLDTPSVCKIVISDQTTKSAELSAKLRSLGADACLGKESFGRDREKFFAEVSLACERHATRYSQKAPAAKTVRPPPISASDGDPYGSVACGYPIPYDEKSRIELLEKKGLSNIISERHFDLITKYVSETTGYPMSFLTFIGRDTAWAKSSYGIEPAGFLRSESFCSYTIGQHNTLSVKDATKDVRFSHLESVVGPMSVRSYVGQPIIGKEGTRLGALCVVDQIARAPSKEVIEHLKVMAAILAEIINVRPNIQVSEAHH